MDPSLRKGTGESGLVQHQCGLVQHQSNKLDTTHTKHCHDQDLTQDQRQLQSTKFFVQSETLGAMGNGS